MSEYGRGLSPGSSPVTLGKKRSGRGSRGLWACGLAGGTAALDSAALDSPLYPVPCSLDSAALDSALSPRPWTALPPLGALVVRSLPE